MKDRAKKAFASKKPAVNPDAFKVKEPAEPVDIQALVDRTKAFEAGLVKTEPEAKTTKLRGQTKDLVTLDDAASFKPEPKKPEPKKPEPKKPTSGKKK